MLNKNIVFCFTGKGPYTREEMQAMAVKAGASFTQNITQKTTTLVIMDMNSQSIKAQKARANGIDLIGPETFIAICNNNKYLPNKNKIEEEKRNIEQNVGKPLRKIIIWKNN